MTVLIMCQGEQRRLATALGGSPKQLLRVGHETILARTVRMIREYDPALEITVVARHDDAFMGACQDLEVALATLPHPGSCIVDGLVASRPLWQGSRVIALLGDVVWSRAALPAVLADRRPLVFAGTPAVTSTDGEIFAASWDPGSSASGRTTPYDLMTSCPCRSDPRNKRVRTFAQQQGGHMRRLLWWAQQHKHQYRGKEPMAELYLPIRDYTDDIDTPSDLVRLDELGAAIAAEQ